MLLSLIAAAASLAPNAANDICLAMIPPRLAAQLASDQPDYTLPHLTDAKPERLLAIAQAGGWPCPYVAIGDFDGDGMLDRAVILKRKSGIGVRLIAARQIDGVWKIELQKDWPIAMESALVQPLEPGLYQHSEAGHTPDNLDDLAELQSDRPGFEAGQAEGAKAAFFFQNDKWQELWLDD